MTTNYQLQKLCKEVAKLQRNIVREFFSDVEESEEALEELIKEGQRGSSTYNRSLLKFILTPRNEDTVLYLILRILFYYLAVNPPVPMLYGMPVTTFQETFSYLPQIELFFKQFDNFDDEFPPVEMQISFRLKADASEISPVDIRLLAEKIQKIFAPKLGAEAKPFKFQKGQLKVNYRKGPYRLSIWSYSKPEAIDLIKKVLEIQGDAYDEKALTLTDKESPYPVIEQQRLAQQVVKWRQRPKEWVRFEAAFLHIHKMKPQCLVDLSFRRTAIVRV